MILPSNSKGFTLIELLVVITIIGLISGGAVLLITNVMQRSRYDITIKRMEDLKNAIIGNSNLIKNDVRTDFGYNGDMGRLPTGNVLNGLAVSETPAWDPITQCGWHGPYVRSPFTEDSDAYKKDGWGNDFVFNSTTGVITSKGSNGAIGGSDWASDINSESLNTLITNSVTIKAYDKSGNPATGSTITIYYPVAGTESNTPHVLVSGDAGVYIFSNIPTGIRKVIVTFGSGTYTRWLPVVPSVTVSSEFNLVPPATTPNPPTGISGTPYSTTQIRLSWTAPTLNADGSTLLDLDSYNIYRSIVSGTETFLTNIGNTNAYFMDTGLTEAQTYYYKVSAVNSGSSISAQSLETNAKASPIQQNLAISPAFGSGNNELWDIRIRNYGPGTIVFSTIQLTWTVSANQATLNRLRINSGVWTTIWNGSVSTPTSTFSIDDLPNLATGTDYTLRLRFDRNPGTNRYPNLSSLTIRINTSDALLIVY